MKQGATLQKFFLFLHQLLASVLHLSQFCSGDFLMPETFGQSRVALLQLLADLSQGHIPLLLLLLQIMHPLDTGLDTAQLLYQSGVRRMLVQPAFHGGLLAKDIVKRLPPAVTTCFQ